MGYLVKGSLTSSLPSSFRSFNHSNPQKTHLKKQPGYILGKRIASPPSFSTTTGAEEEKEGEKGFTILFDEFLPHVLKQHRQVMN